MNASRNRYSSNPTYGSQKKPPVKKKSEPIQNMPAPEQMPGPGGQSTPYAPMQPAGYAQYTPPQAPYQPSAYLAPQQPVPGYAQPPMQQAPYAPPVQQVPGYPPPTQQGQAGWTGYPPPQNTQPPAPNAPVQSPQPDESAVSQDGWLKLIFFLALPVLFVLSFILPGVAFIKWLFIIAAVLGVTGMWFLSGFAYNAKTTLTLICVPLIAVHAFTLYNTPAPDRQSQSGSAYNGSQSGGNAGTPSLNPLSGGTNIGQLNPVNGDGSLVQPLSEEHMPDPNEAAANLSEPGVSMTSEAVKRLDNFFYLWSANKTDEMLELCAPTWRNSLQGITQNVGLFTLLGIRIPTEYSIDAISGTDADMSRTATVTATIDKRNGQAPEKYRYQVMLLNEGSVWYVAPQSIKSSEPERTADPNASVATTEPGAVPTVTPKPDAESRLYYNADGGKKYHSVPDCKSVNSKYIPLSPFKFGDLNTNKFKSLVPCAECRAPARP